MGTLDLYKSEKYCVVSYVVSVISDDPHDGGN